MNHVMKGVIWDRIERRFDPQESSKGSAGATECSTKSPQH